MGWTGSLIVIGVATMVSVHTYSVTRPHRAYTGSDVIHMNVVGQSIVILNSWDAVNDLIEKRSNLYSSRWAYFISPEVTTDLLQTYSNDGQRAVSIYSQSIGLF